MTQDSRIALIELLFLSLYLDNHLSLAEDEVLTSALDSIGWESSEPRELAIFRAFSLAREASTSLPKMEEFLNARTTVIKSAGESAEGLTWLTKLLAADGLTSGEKYFLAKVEERLFP